MITSFYRPESISEAVRLLAREDEEVRPLGGGTVLSRQQETDFAVADLTRLGLDRIEQDGQLLSVGATVTLQALMEHPDFPEGMGVYLRESIYREAGANIRRAASVAGSVVSCDGRSPFVAALMALDTRLVWAGDGPAPGTGAGPEGGQLVTQSLGDFLPLRQESWPGRLITHLRFPLNAALGIEMVSRTPLDRPVVIVAVATWPSGRTRVVLGGYGKAPILAMDGPEPAGAVPAAREAFRFAEDAWASAAYRMEVAGTLVKRLLAGKKGRDEHED